MCVYIYGVWTHGYKWANPGAVTDRIDVYICIYYKYMYVNLYTYMYMYVCIHSGRLGADRRIRVQPRCVYVYRYMYIDI